MKYAPSEQRATWGGNAGKQASSGGWPMALLAIVEEALPLPVAGSAGRGCPPAGCRDALRGNLMVVPTRIFASPPTPPTPQK